MRTYKVVDDRRGSIFPLRACMSCILSTREGGKRRDGPPIVHKLKLARSSPSCCSVVKTAREIGGATERGPFGGVTGSMTVKQMETGDTTGMGSFGTGVNTE